MDTISNYKNRALESLQGRWKKPCLGCLAYWGISMVFIVVYTIAEVVTLHVLKSPVLTYFDYFIGFLLLPLVWGLVVEFLLFVRSGEFHISEMVQRGYQDFTRIFCTLGLVCLYTYLWMLLLIVPGIIKSLSYALTPFILYDNPQMKNNEAIELSMAMMEGRKMQLFLLYLSFIGWSLLCILTLGIGLIWLIPYMYTTLAHFYEDAKAEYNA